MPNASSVYSTSRNWNDFTYPAGDPRNGNYVPDCDLTHPLLEALGGVGRR